MSVTQNIIPVSTRGTVLSEETIVRILSFQAFNILVLSFFFYPMRVGVLCASGAISLMLYSRLLYVQVLRDPFGISPFILYLFLGWIRLGLAPIYLSAVVVFGHVDALSFAGYDTSAHYIPGYHLELLGNWFFLLGYFAFERFSSPQKPLRFLSPVIGPNALLRSAFFLLAIIYGIRLAPYFDIPAHRFGQLYTFINAYGPSAALLVLIFAIKKSPSENKPFLLLFTAIVFLIDLKIVFNSYMKQHVIVYVLPLFIYFITSVRKITPGFRPKIRYKRLAAVIIISFIFLSVLFTYSEIRRGAFWDASGVVREQKPEISSYLFRTLGSFIPGSETFSSTHSFPKKGFWRILYRNTLLVGEAWCYAFVQANGTTDGRYFKQIPYILIPRFLWPEKPQVSYGRHIAVLLGQARFFETATTATVFSMSGGFYWAWGYPSVVIGMFFNGMAFYLAWKIFSASIMLNPISTLICISLFLKGLRHFEGVFDGNVVDYILIFAFFLPLSRLWGSIVTIRQTGDGKQKVPIITNKHQQL